MGQSISRCSRLSAAGIAFVATGLLFGNGSSARAQQATAAFTLSTPIVSVTPGNYAFFSGFIANTSTPVVGTDPAEPFLLVNDIRLDNLATPQTGSFTLDRNYFFANVPGFFAAGDTYTGPIFRIFVAAGTRGGDYTATATLLGGADQDATSPIASAPFTLRVVSPEPTSVGLVLGGALTTVFAMSAGARRRRIRPTQSESAAKR